MIKILFIGMTPNPGGMETFMINVFSKLEGHGFHFEFLNIFHKNIAYTKYILRNNGNIIHLSFPMGNIKRHFERFHIAKSFFKRHHSYDIVHLNALSLNNIFWIKAAKECKIKHLIIQSHNCGIEYKSRLISFLAHLLFIYNKLYLYNNLDIIKLAASSNCGKWMFGNLEFMVINNGIYTRPYKFKMGYRKLYKNKLGFTSNEKIIITTSRLWKQKNYPKVIDVFRCIHNKNKYARLVIIGSGPEYGHIVSMVKLYGLINYVYFLGSKDKKVIAKLLSIADLMLMPSLHEAVPFSLTEAQAAGVPALVSLNAIPKEANISGYVYYLSLGSSNEIWAKVALKILKNHFSVSQKVTMNNRVHNSLYNINNSIYKLKDIYSSMIR